MVGYGIKDMLSHRNRSALYYGKLLIDVASVRRPTDQTASQRAREREAAVLRKQSRPGHGQADRLCGECF